MYWKLLTLDWLDFTVLTILENVIRRKLLRDGIEHQRFYGEHKFTRRRLTCGLLDVFLPKCWEEFHCLRWDYNDIDENWYGNGGNIEYFTFDMKYDCMWHLHRVLWGFLRRGCEFLWETLTLHTYTLIPLFCIPKFLYFFLFSIKIFWKALDPPFTLPPLF
jgi:hypothetical protein